MISDIGTVITGIINAIGDFLSPSANENTGSFLTATAIASMAALFGVPVLIGVIRKVVSLIKAAKGN